ncbi:hypothetical protein [Shewanella xiamenensis]|uniref:hypothetical protein n=1 Tax=Shewanella xiamenensis TaxID=332186 RepID=UPI001CC798D0|nr:hypothetical protein [Shewanella xiamenensis]BDA59918.1 hypothetical protein NUITMVS1_13810 [Shewanella xiamenensis]
MKIFINYSDERFKRKQQFSAFMAKLIGGFDKVIEYSSVDIDKSYYEKNKLILDSERGGGYWLWKPYLINKTLKCMQDGDYLFYCDSGAYFIKSVNEIVENMESSSEDIAVFQLPLAECEFTNKYTRNFFNYDESDPINQILGGYICIKKSQDSVRFIEQYQQFCENADLVTDKNTLDGELHRHDQSILSLLAKRHKIKPFRDPSDYGEFPKRYYRYGFQFVNNDIRGSYPTLILSNRKENPVVYGAKYFLRRMLKWI